MFINYFKYHDKYIDIKINKLNNNINWTNDLSYNYGKDEK